MMEELPLTNNVAAIPVKVEVTQDQSPTERDSGVVDGSASENTPSSVADTLESTGPEENSKLLERPEVERIIKVEELEDYVMERKENDCEGLRKEYEVSLIPAFLYVYKYVIGSKGSSI